LAQTLCQVKRRFAEADKSEPLDPCYWHKYKVPRVGDNPPGVVRR
jgi:hypothetical protein